MYYDGLFDNDRGMGERWLTIETRFIGQLQK